MTYVCSGTSMHECKHVRSRTAHVHDYACTSGHMTCPTFLFLVGDIQVKSPLMKSKVAYTFKNTFVGVDLL